MSKSSQVAQSRTPIDKLPPELLDHIFHFAHEDFEANTLVQGFEQGLIRPEIKGFGDEESAFENAEDDRLEVSVFTDYQASMLLFSSEPNFFPYALATVSPLWETVLSWSPEFWTQLVLLVGICKTPFERARKYLAWSRNLAIDVFIRNKHHRGVDHTEFEREVVAEFIDILRPHMTRCRSLHIDVCLNTALPTLHFIPRASSALRALYIRSMMGDATRDDMSLYSDESEAGDQDENGSAGSNSIEGYPLRLQTMKIDGQTFRRTLRNPPSWFMHQPQLRHLEIEEIREDHSIEEIGWLRYDISLRVSLHCISGNLSRVLTYLFISRLMFKIDTQDIADASFEFPHLQHLQLCNIEAKAISELFRVSLMPDLDILKIHKCDHLSPTIFTSIGHSLSFLILDEYGSDGADDFSESIPWADQGDSDRHLPSRFIPFDDQRSDAIRFISGWVGDALWFWKSKMSFDPIIGALSSQDAVNPYEFVCHDMCALLLKHCRAPSFVSIKRMIEMRNASVDYSDPEWRDKLYDAPVVTKITFRECQLMWSPEEIEWVNQRVIDFNWE